MLTVILFQIFKVQQRFHIHIMCLAFHYWIDTPSKSHPSLGFGWASILYIKFILNDWLVVVLVEIAHLHEQFADIYIKTRKIMINMVVKTIACTHTNTVCTSYSYLPFLE